MGESLGREELARDLLQMEKNMPPEEDKGRYGRD